VQEGEDLLGMVPTAVESEEDLNLVFARKPFDVHYDVRLQDASVYVVADEAVSALLELLVRNVLWLFGLFQVHLELDGVLESVDRPPEEVQVLRVLQSVQRVRVRLVLSRFPFALVAR